MEVAHQIEREACRHLAGEYAGQVDLRFTSGTLADDVEDPDHGAQRGGLDAALQIGLFLRQNFVAHVLEKNLVAQPDQSDNPVVHQRARRNIVTARRKRGKLGIDEKVAVESSGWDLEYHAIADHVHGQHSHQRLLGRLLARRAGRNDCRCGAGRAPMARGPYREERFVAYLRPPLDA